MTEYIQFTSNFKDFKINEKLDFNSKTNSLDVLKYYISIQTPINLKITNLLEKILTVKKFETENKDLFLLDESSFIKEINSRNFKKKVNELLSDYEKDLKKALFLSCKVYIFEKYFSKKGILPSFHKM